MFINEIPLHDTINESSRARDELTKFVSLLKMQINAKIVGEPPAMAVNSHSMSQSLNSSVGGYSSGATASYRGFASSSHIMPPVGTPIAFLHGMSSHSLPSAKRMDISSHRTSLAMGNEEDENFRRMMSIPTKHGGTYGGQTQMLIGNGRNGLVASTVGRKAPKGGVCECGLPGCHLEGTYICSACNKTGYCGSDHQR